MKAAELLKHPHLQPYVFQINLKASAPRKLFPIKQPASNAVKMIRFPDDEEDSLCKDKERYKTFSNERTLKLTQPASQQDSFCSTQSIKHYPDYIHRKIKDLSLGSSQVGEYGSEMTISEKTISNAKASGYTPSKTIATPGRKLDQSRTTYTRTTYDMVSSKQLLACNLDC